MIFCTSHRLLVVDDNPSIHDDFRKILCSPAVAPGLAQAETALFGTSSPEMPNTAFEIDSAYQGQDGLKSVNEGVRQGRPYAIVFIDMEMPPGWDGLETAQRILLADRHVQVVICTAFSQRSWSEIVDAVDDSDRLLIIKKPFDVDEILQLAHSLAQRWRIGIELEELADARARKLEFANKELRVQVQERVNAETALGLTEQRLQLALDAANDGLFDWDLASGEIYLSPRWEKMLGYSPTELPAKSATLRRLMHPEDAAPTFRVLRQHIGGEHKSFEAEYRMRSKDGDWVWILGRAKAVDWSDGHAVRVVGTHTDITERKWIEKALLEREKQFRTIVSNIPGVVYRRIADKCWTTKFVSDNIEKISGYPACEFIENGVRSYASLVHPDDLDAAIYGIEMAVEYNEPYTLEYRLIDAAGTIRWVIEKGAVIVDPNTGTCNLDGVIFDVTETHALEEQLSYHECRDVLTGLLNRKEFTRELQRALAAATAGDSGYALCYMDLDNFKVINDTCGHAGGDKMLGQLGAALREHLRDRDTIARLGGDEFGILLRNCDGEHLERVSTSICETAEAFRFEWQGRTLRVSASVGVVELNSEMQSVEDSLRISEAACYVAKESGRNKAHLYRKDDSIVVRRKDEMRWVPRIHRALESDQFILFQQPIVPLKEVSSQGRHYEILVRMRNRNGDIVLPGCFLPAAERYHLAHKIDHYVVNKVVDWLSDHPRHVKELQLCSINLSGQSLTDDEFCSQILERIRVAGIDPSKLCFEVTETAAVENLRSANQFLEQLRQFGCRTALDDFGAGLSSFGYLATLPVDYLKIDGMFVRDIVQNPVHQAMVRAINEVGQLMGKRTVAEFVESDEAAKLLVELGVDYGQGYGIGRPEPL